MSPDLGKPDSGKPEFGKPRAYAGSSATDSQAVARAVHWAGEVRTRVGGAVMLHVPAKANLTADPRLEQLSRSVPVKTWRAGPTQPWCGGPVISAWPDRTHLGEIDDDPRTRALVVIGWSEPDVSAWLTAHAPALLDPRAQPPAAPAALDPVVVRGLRTLTVLVNHGNNLAGALDKRDAVNVLNTLHRGGHVLDPDGIYAWALADEHWHARGAERLRELAASIAAGRHPRGGNPSALRADILQQWRADAATTDG